MDFEKIIKSQRANPIAEARTSMTLGLTKDLEIALKSDAVCLYLAADICADKGMPSLHQELLRIRGNVLEAINERARLLERVKVLETSVDEIVGCFEAAYAEGLADRLNELDDNAVGSLHDLIMRRVLHAHLAATRIQIACAPLKSGKEKP